MYALVGSRATSWRCWKFSRIPYWRERIDESEIYYGTCTRRQDLWSLWYLCGCIALITLHLSILPYFYFGRELYLFFWPSDVLCMMVAGAWWRCGSTSQEIICWGMLSLFFQLSLSGMLFDFDIPLLLSLHAMHTSMQICQHYISTVACQYVLCSVASLALSFPLFSFRISDTVLESV